MPQIAISRKGRSEGGDDDDEEEDNMMEDEDMDGLAEDLDFDGYNEYEVDENDEKVPIPGSWNQELASVMTVDDGHESGWEYHQNNIEIGAMYPSKKHLKEAIVQ